MDYCYKRLGDVEADVDTLRKYRKLAHNNTHLFIPEHANRDRLVLAHSLVGGISYLSDIGGSTAVLEKSRFDVKRSVLSSCWNFYRVENRSYIFIDEICFEFRVYSLHELIEIAERAGWMFVDVYGELRTLSRFTPSLSSINAVFKANPAI